MSRRGEKRRVRAHRLSNERDRSKAQRFDHRHNAGDERRPREGSRFTLAAAMTTLIDRNHAIPARKRRRGLGPLPRMPRQTVEQQHRRS